MTDHFLAGAESKLEVEYQVFRRNHDGTLTWEEPQKANATEVVDEGALRAFLRRRISLLEERKKKLLEGL